jgi:hypothetical protein
MAAIVQEEQVTIHLINGSGRAGLGQQVAAELTNRGFWVADVADGPEFDGIAALDYGPEGIGAAWLVTAYFLHGDMDSTFDPQRVGADIDLVLGHRYERLNTVIEVNQRIAALGPPTAPPGTCGHTPGLSSSRTYSGITSAAPPPSPLR